MPTTDILTFDQGIILMIETGFFLLFYYIYHMFFGGKMAIASIFFTTLLFALWLLSVTVVSNITMALNFPLPRTSSIPFHDEGFPLKKN